MHVEDYDRTGRTDQRTVTVELAPETVDRLDRVREDGESYDDLVTELLDIYEASTLTMAHAGDAVAEPSTEPEPAAARVGTEVTA